MSALHALNLGARFSLELLALGLVSYLAYRLVSESGWGTVAAIAAPVVLALAWATLAAPKAAVALPGLWKVVIQMVLLLLPVAGLASVGKAGWAATYGSAVVANAALMAWWDQ